MIKNLQDPLFREIAKPAFYLFMFALVGVLILSLIHSATEGRIEENERAALLEKVNVLVKSDRYDNDPLLDQVTLPGETLGSATPVTVYRARKDNQPVAAVYVTTSPNGYSGKIRMVIGINADQTVAGVRVVSHKETPGLGDRIEAQKNNWIKEFAEKSLQNPELNGWAVKKDGGQFDQFTGATITPRAVVNMVRSTLLWSQDNQDALFQMPAELNTDE